MEMTAHKDRKESKEPRAHRGQPEMTVKMDRMVPKGHKVYKAPKGHKGQPEQMVLVQLLKYQFMEEH
jgi:hypothetical protein